MLLLPVGEQIQTGVIDVIQMFKMHMYLGAWPCLFQSSRQFWQADQRRRTAQMQIQAIVDKVLIPFDFKMRENIEQLEQGQQQTEQHALEQIGRYNNGDSGKVDRRLGFTEQQQLGNNLGISQLVAGKHQQSR